MYRRMLNMTSVQIQRSSHQYRRRTLSVFPKNSARILSSVYNPQKTMSTLAEEEKKTLNTLVHPWTNPVVESHGDYRAEAFLESYIGGPLYEHQSELPRLPIPTLEETMDRFLPTALPLARTEQEKMTLLEACAKFPTQAKVLQERLHERRNGEMKDSSWLQHWWNTAGYLQVRDPVVINVSYFFHFSDDPTLPVDKPRNVTRGAAILTALAQFRQQVVTGALPADKVGRPPKEKFLCSTAYKYMFNATRIPHREMDSYKMYDPALHGHCIVARQGQFFAVDFVDKSTGLPYPVGVLEDRLMECIQIADDESAASPLELGWLTSQDRDSWADARDEMIRVGGSKMEEALELLESGAFMLNLDDEEAVSRKQCAELFLHGNITSGHNRWFDKSIQILCGNNGKAGLCGEHSMMDGMPMVGLADHLTKTTYDKALQAQTASSSDKSGGVRNVFQHVYPLLEASSVPSLVNRAKEHLTNLVLDHEIEVQSFHGYGSNFIKKAGYSPDAFVQIAMQLATYRLFGEQAGTYEATQVRPFLHGRTETTRTVSPASEAFVKRMGFAPRYDEHDDSIRKEKLDLLQDAVMSHVAYIGNAAKGQGVDRHLFGLSMLFQQGEETPELYSHPVFARSKRWRVSTSHLTHPNFDNWGYGEVVPDGVGLSYAIKADSCVFSITALREHQWPDRLCHYLEEALMEMRGMIELEQKKAPSSKL